MKNIEGENKSKGLDFVKPEKEKRPGKLKLVHKAPSVHKKDRQIRMSKRSLVNRTLVAQNKQIDKRILQLSIANKKLVFRNRINPTKVISDQEHALRKLNAELERKVTRRTTQYAFISQVNQAIVHDKDVDTLFRNACRIALEFGKFRMAWIDSFEQPGKKISLLHYSGIAPEDIHLFTDAHCVPNGPRDSVLRMCKFYLSNDIKNAPAPEIWKAYAAKHHISSCITLPVKKGGKIFGTLNLYASDINFFAEDDIKLLIEVAGDISFGLDLLEKAKTHKEAEERIIENEKRFSALIEKSNDMKTLATADGKRIYASPSVFKILGYSPEVFLEIPGIDLIHPGDAPSMLKKIHRILNTPGSSFYSQHRLRHKKGHYIWCEGTITNMLSEPYVNAIVSNFRDISDKKLIEQRQEFNSNNLTALINNTSDLMWSVDKEFRLITSNKSFDDAARSISADSCETGTGDSVFGLGFSDEQVSRYKKYYERAFSGEAFTEIEFTGEEAEFWLEISFNPIKKGKEIIGTACHSHNISAIKKSERQIKKSEAFALGILNSLASHIAVIDESGKIVAVNESWSQFALRNGKTTLERTGVGSNYYQVCRKSIEQGDSIAKEALSGLMEVMSKSRDSLYLEYPCHSPNKQQWFGMRATKFESSLPMVVVAHIDITERRLAEENSFKTEARLKEAQSIAKVGNWEIDLATGTHIWSDEFYNIHRILKEQIVPSAEAFLSFIHPDDLASAQQKMDDAFKSLQASSMNFRFLLLDGTVKYGYTEWRFEFDKSNRPIRLFGIFQDVTEQKSAERVLVRSESRLAEAQALAKVGNWETNLATLKVIWSAETYRIFDVDPETFPASHAAFIEHVHPADRSKVEAAFENSYSSDTINSIEHRIITPTGVIKIIEERWQVFRDVKGSPKDAVGTCQDITDRKVAEEEREKLTHELIQRNRDLEQFTFIISHNLRAPTANIIGFAEYLQDDTLTILEKKELLQGLSFSASGLDTVIKDLNAILQVKHQINEKRELVSFSSLLNEIVTSNNTVFEKKQVRIKADFSDVDEIFSLKAYLHSIFYNLISNSIKYSNPDMPPRIEIKSVKDQEKIVLLFKDNGLGIDLATQGKKVFGLYKRFHSHVEGKGLGLFMVKTQVEAIGGRITVASEPFKGTEFTIVFNI
jgi:PAS domain S-box-containing protein